MSNKFIAELAAYVQKYAASFDIRVHSAIIAQGILESASGTSYKATFGHNYHGLKYRENRVPVSIGKFTDSSVEDRGDHNEKIVDEWFKFANMEDGVLGYFQFINTSHYANLKGVTDPRKYLENIKLNNFATDKNYVEKCMDIIEKYDLTKYDNHVMEGKSMLKIAIDAGHGINTPGKRCMKALDPNESREWGLNARIADKLEGFLFGYQCEVIRVDDPTGKKDISLNERCQKANAWGADVYISIHHDAAGKKGTHSGTTVFYYSSKAEREKQAEKLYNYVVHNTGLRGDRSQPIRKYKYAVLSGTNMPAFLIENGFMDSTKDVPIILSENHATNTALGIVDFLLDVFDMKKNPGEIKEQPKKEEAAAAQTPPAAASGVPYVVKITASALNVRAGAGTGNKIVGCITDDQKAIKDNPKYYFPKTKYTIIEEESGWGKLKSGAGWISLKYTEKA